MLVGRSDILALLSRLKHRETTGQISSWRRSATCLAMILRERRTRGLTQPGQPVAGLPDDFAARRDDFRIKPPITSPAGPCPSVRAVLCHGRGR